MVKQNAKKTKNSTKKKSAARATTARSGKIQAVKRVAQKVPKKKVSVLVLVVLAMASMVTMAWLFDKV